MRHDRDDAMGEPPVPGEFDSALPEGRSWDMLLIGLLGMCIGVAGLIGLACGLYFLGHPG